MGHSAVELVGGYVHAVAEFLSAENYLLRNDRVMPISAAMSAGKSDVLSVTMRMFIRSLASMLIQLKR